MTSRMGTPARRAAGVLVAWTLAVLAPGAHATEGDGPLELIEPPCAQADNAVVVLTGRRELWLCARGAPPARYAISLGRSGTGKRRRGDGRTPLGTYALGVPRPSSRYGSFIPIAYPTVAQAARGYSGSAIGIHGPPRGITPAEYPVTEVDWTHGCIATSTDEEVDAIASFVRERRPRVVIR